MPTLPAAGAGGRPRGDPHAIKENKFNLNIPRYVDTFEPEPEVDIPAVRREIAALENELAAVEKELEGHLKVLGL